MSATTRLEIEALARTSALIASLATIGEFCDARNLGPDVAARVRIIVEELFLNTIKYGYATECDRPVRLSLEAAPGVILTYEDDAPAFDPTLWAGGDGRRAGEDTLRLGEAGLDLLFGLATHVDYQPREAGNRLVVTFAYS
jgi:anti-sigma regulatory factor (Ser/Thr protein kinase)